MNVLNSTPMHDPGPEELQRPARVCVCKGASVSIDQDIQTRKGNLLPCLLSCCCWRRRPPVVRRSRLRAVPPPGACPPESPWYLPVGIWIFFFRFSISGVSFRSPPAGKVGAAEDDRPKVKCLLSMVLVFGRAKLTSTKRGMGLSARELGLKAMKNSGTAIFSNPRSENLTYLQPLP